MKPLGIYVHIPFCLKKCGYCDFNSVAFEDYDRIEQYLGCLYKDIIDSASPLKEYLVQTIYIGGGTPSLLEPSAISRLLKIFKENYNLANSSEITIEANPASLSKSKADSWSNAGINRASIGVQSFNDRLLKFLQRAHDSKQILTAIATLKKSGYKNISIDLIYGMPGQSLEDWTNDLEKAVDCNISHISLYDLKIEKGTPFYKIKDSLKLADDQLQILMYQKACAVLEKAGFKHYEISSFAKAGKSSQHNKTYWKNQSYAGFGAGAYSYIERQRYGRVKDIKEYCRQVSSGKIQKCGLEALNKQQLLGETIMLNLRLLDGLNLKEIEDQLKFKISNELLELFVQYTAQGLLEYKNGKYMLSRKGLLNYDTIAGEFLV